MKYLFSWRDTYLVCDVVTSFLGLLRIQVVWLESLLFGNTFVLFSHEISIDIAKIKWNIKNDWGSHVMVILVSGYICGSSVLYKGPSNFSLRRYFCVTSHFVWISHGLWWKVHNLCLSLKDIYSVSYKVLSGWPVCRQSAQSRVRSADPTWLGMRMSCRVASDCFF